MFDEPAWMFPLGPIRETISATQQPATPACTLMSVWLPALNSRSALSEDFIRVSFKEVASTEQHLRIIMKGKRFRRKNIS
jgi:hypothetical protein